MNEEYFCLLTVKNTTTLAISISMAAISLLIIVVAFRNYCHMRNYQNNHSKCVYVLMLFWWICKFIFNEVFILKTIMEISIYCFRNDPV